MAEDPHRRELYRLWLARNCNFINNYIPLLLLATGCNMDFQPTTTKFGVLEYMTKYMTKSGAGSLLHVMETSFSACMEKAKDKNQGIPIMRTRYILVTVTFVCQLCDMCAVKT